MGCFGAPFCPDTENLWLSTVWTHHRSSLQWSFPVRGFHLSIDAEGHLGRSCSCRLGIRGKIGDSWITLKHRGDWLVCFVFFRKNGCLLALRYESYFNPATYYKPPPIPAQSSIPAHDKTVGIASRRRDPAEDSGTFWYISLVCKICNLLYILTGSQRNKFYSKPNQRATATKTPSGEVASNHLSYMIATFVCTKGESSVYSQGPLGERDPFFSTVSIVETTRYRTCATASYRIVNLCQYFFPLVLTVVSELISWAFFYKRCALVPQHFNLEASMMTHRLEGHPYSFWPWIPVNRGMGGPVIVRISVALPP